MAVIIIIIRSMNYYELTYLSINYYINCDYMY